MRKSLACRAILASTRSILATAAAIGIGLAGASSAKAAKITETFTFPTLNGYGAEDGSSFSAFDPALGILNSVTYDVTVTAEFTGGGAEDANAAEYRLSFQGPTGATTADPLAFNIGDGTTNAKLSSTVGSPEIDAFQGPGTVDSSVEVFNSDNTPASVVSTFATESVTYNYTPAQIVPEASTWAMMLIGFAGLGAAAYRRRGAVAVSA